MSRWFPVFLVAAFATGVLALAAAVVAGMDFAPTGLWQLLALLGLYLLRRQIGRPPASRLPVRTQEDAVRFRTRARKEGG